MTGLVEKKTISGTRCYRNEDGGIITKECTKYYENEDGGIIAKECTKCGRVRIIDDFSKAKKGFVGSQSRCKLCQRKYREENPHVGSAARHRRLARKSLLPDTLTKEQLEEITDRFRGGCALTGCTDGTHLDHVIPLATGHGGTTEQNMIPLRADLNISKQARCIFDWFYDVKDRFKLSQTKFDELIEYLAEVNGMTANEYEDYVRWCHDNPRVIDETILDETGSAG